MSEILWWQWALAALGAFLVGLGKGGLPGVGNFTVLQFASAFEAKASVGLLLPVLISADAVAIVVYRREVGWGVLWRLWPWMALGVVLGTMLANAGGPVGQLFLLSADLRKLAFIGTGAWLFFLINVFKLPFQSCLGILSFGSLAISAVLMPAAMAGALLAPRLVRYINEMWFMRLIWVFIVVAGVKLVFL